MGWPSEILQHLFSYIFSNPMKIVSSTPRLILCAHTWSMVGYPTPRREWTLTRKLEAIRAAGFDGVAAFISPEIKAGADRLGLKLLSGFDCGDLPTVRRRLEEQRRLGVRYINIQLLNHDTPPARAAAMAVQLIRLSRRLGLAVHVETHRDTSTETPEKYTEIARRYRRATGETMPTTWDHSHFAVSKHVLPKDYAARLLEWPREIQHSQIFHLRPFNSQHCQVPVTNGRGRLTPEFADYLAFVEELFVVWLRGPRPGGELWACPEMGMTHGYHVSTNPPVWPDVIRCRTELLRAWRRALRRVS
jgi:sugar phosphate isomerase/epimerase